MAARVTKVQPSGPSTEEIRLSDEWEDHFNNRIEWLRDEGLLAPGPIPQDRWEEIAKYADDQVRKEIHSGNIKELSDPMSAKVIAIRESDSPVGPLKWKKGPDFEFNGEWILTAPSGKKAVVSFSRDYGSGSWFRANAGLAPVGVNHTLWGYIGDSRAEVERKLQNADHPAWSDKQS